jgi:hypothetical protein
MCRPKECPECHMLVPAHVVICTTGGPRPCHHVFIEALPAVAPIGRTYPVGTNPDDNSLYHHNVKL